MSAADFVVHLPRVIGMGEQARVVVRDFYVACSIELAQMVDIGNVADSQRFQHRRRKPRITQSKEIHTGGPVDRGQNDRIPAKRGPGTIPILSYSLPHAYEILAFHGTKVQGFPTLPSRLIAA